MICQQQQKLLSATFIVGRREIKFIKNLKSLNPCISRIVLFTLQFQAADKINTHMRRNRWVGGSAPSHLFFAKLQSYTLPYLKKLLFIFFACQDF